jgi:hypothetical protein
MQIETGKQHEIQSHLQTFLKLRIARPMPLTQKPAAEQNQRIVARPPIAGIVSCGDEKWPRSGPIHQRRRLQKHIDRPKPPSALLQKQVQDKPPD